jgi:hypothetical protein
MAIVAGRSTQPLAIMWERGPFWNKRIALAMAAVAALVFTGVLLSGVRDNALVLAILVFPVMAIASISHAITNKTFFFVPWKTYQFTVLERWSWGIGMTIFISAMLAGELLKHGP